MRKAILYGEQECFRYKVEELKKILHPISAIFNGDVLIETAFTFKPGVARTERISAFMNPNVTHIQMHRNNNETRDGLPLFRAVSYTPFDSWNWDGTVGKNAFITAMYELAQQEM